MANTLHEIGRQNLLAGTINWATGFGGSGAIFAALHDCATTSAGVKAITGATNASPIAITATAHGFSNGDVVNILGVGGNLAANGIFQVSGAATNTFNLVNYFDGTTNTTGSAAYTSGGIAVNLGGPSNLGTWASYSAGLVGTAVALSGETETQGVANASSVTFTAVSGNQVKAVFLIATAAAGSLASTDKIVAFIDGNMIVTCAATTSSSATTLPVESIAGPIANSTVLTFDNGASATLSGAASQFARTLSVSSTAATISAGNRATAPASGSGLPVTPNGGNISITFDTARNKIFKL